MTYRTVLKTSEDFYKSLEKSRQIADKLTETLRKNGKTDAVVRSYSYPDVFYEQYLTMWKDTRNSLSLSIFAVFVVVFLFLGLDLYSASIVTLSIIMIIVNLMGLMYWWDISLNAISLVNLVVVSILYVVQSLLCLWLPYNLPDGRPLHFIVSFSMTS